MEHPQEDPAVILLQDLPVEYYRLQFLVSTQSESLKKEMEISLQAGNLVGKIHAAFPYVNGGLFQGDIEIPQLTEEIKDLILHKGSEDFDWSKIFPAIFGAVFESTLNPETRRKGGMHYTSIENIHKVIDPLFLDDLREEFAAIKGEKVSTKRKQRLEAFQNKLSGLCFLEIKTQNLIQFKVA